MKSKLLMVLAVLGSLAMFSAPARAQLPMAGYDMTKTITVHGTVHKVRLEQSHVVVYVGRQK